MGTEMQDEIETPEPRAHVYGDETRQALIQAAIKIIAQNGVAGASLRAINVAAGCRNSSAAHYHFGTKLAIIDAALDHIMAQVQRVQEPLLAASEERVRFGRPISVREAIEAAYLPYLALLMRPDYGPTAAKFVSRLLVDSDADLQGLINRSVAPVLYRCLALAQAALPGIPEDVLKVRLLITITNIVHGAGDFSVMQNSPFGDLTGDNPLRVLHVLLDYLTAAVSAPAAPFSPADETRMAATLFPAT